ncbi:MAG: hypothetical protein IPK64_06165 [bacterium]|nr:hypothetical protein [bacterium]
MSLSFKKLIIAGAVLALLAGCSRQSPLDAGSGELGPRGSDKDGSEALAPPAIAISPGSGLAHGGVSLVGVEAAELTVTVPAGAQVRQVLLYWAGGSIAVDGDDAIELDGVAVAGELIGGPTWFYSLLGANYHFSAYRADVTRLGLVGPGTTTLTVSGFDFPTGAADENNGASLLVVWDDGTSAGIQLRDGLDLAYFGFAGVLNNTVPQVFAVTPADSDRLAQLVLMAASVGQDRPTRVVVTTTAGVQVFENPMGGADGSHWESIELPVLIPAGVASVTAELVSTPGYTPRGASLGWVGAALVEPAAGQGPAPWTISGTVFVDADQDGTRDESETILPNTAVDLAAAVGTNGITITALTGPDGRYQFSVPAGSYVVRIDTAAHPASFNPDLGAYFEATGPLERAVTVGPSAGGNDFGFKPNDTWLLAAIDSGQLVPEGLTQAMWRQVFRCALLAENRAGELEDEVEGALWRGGYYGDDCGVVTERLFYDAVALRQLLTAVTELHLPEPFVFDEGQELIRAYKLLSLLPRNDEEALLQETLVTELNYVTGRAPAGQLDLIYSLAGWAESLLASSENDAVATADKDRNADLRRALTVLEALNTGGGGGVDE